MLTASSCLLKTPTRFPVPRRAVQSASDVLRVYEAGYGRCGQLSENGHRTRACRRERGGNDNRATGNDGEFPIKRRVTVALDARDIGSASDFEQCDAAERTGLTFVRGDSVDVDACGFEWRAGSIGYTKLHARELRAVGRARRLRRGLRCGRRGERTESESLLPASQSPPHLQHDQELSSWPLPTKCQAVRATPAAKNYAVACIFGNVRPLFSGTMAAHSLRRRRGERRSSNEFAAAITNLPPP